MTAQRAKPDILVVDDEQQIRRLLRFTLEDAGYEVREAESGHLGLVQAAHAQPDAIILDLGLPDMSGVQVLHRVREWAQVPVLVLSVFGQEDSKVVALDAGADDYLTKPFGGGELLARLRALLRRSKAAERDTVLKLGHLEVDLIARRVTRHGQILKLTGREYDMFRLLAVNAGRVVTHNQILSEVWGREAVGNIHYLRVFMMRLRRKIEEDADVPRYLQTESGIGYRLVVD